MADTNCKQQKTIISLIVLSFVSIPQQCNHKWKLRVDWMYCDLCQVIIEFSRPNVRVQTLEKILRPLLISMTNIAPVYRQTYCAGHRKSFDIRVWPSSPFLMAFLISSTWNCSEDVMSPSTTARTSFPPTWTSVLMYSRTSTRGNISTIVLHVAGLLPLWKHFFRHLSLSFLCAAWRAIYLQLFLSTHHFCWVSYTWT